MRQGSVWELDNIRRMRISVLRWVTRLLVVWWMDLVNRFWGRAQILPMTPRSVNLGDVLFAEAPLSLIYCT